MRLRHYDNDGRARFATFCTHRRIPLLTNDRFRQALVDAIKWARKEHEFRLIGYVIMPEHVRLVLLPSGGTQLGFVIGEIKRAASKAIHRLLLESNSALLGRLTVRRGGRAKFALWHRRCYDHNCRTEESVWKKVRYCHENPVKRGLVREPDRWKWSSYSWYQGDTGGPLEMDLGAGPK
jgi:putative transposase